MSDQFKARWITTDEINSVVRKFLSSFDYSDSVPVPIEDIVELDLGMDIITIPGLKDNFHTVDLDIDGFISPDFRSITVDEYVEQKRRNRYRFTLAHEVGHMMLHGYVYEQYSFRTSEEWISIILNMPPRDREIVEWQANEFAGLILVPRRVLKGEFRKEEDEAELRIFEDYPNLDIEEHPNFVMEDSPNFIIQETALARPKGVRPWSETTVFQTSPFQSAKPKGFKSTNL